MKVIVFVIAVLVIFGIAEVMAQNGIAAKGIAGVVAVILYGVIFHKKKDVVKEDTDQLKQTNKNNDSSLLNDN